MNVAKWPNLIKLGIMVTYPLVVLGTIVGRPWAALAGLGGPFLILAKFCQNFFLNFQMAIAPRWIEILT